MKEIYQREVQHLWKMSSDTNSTRYTHAQHKYSYIVEERKYLCGESGGNMRIDSTIALSESFCWMQLLHPKNMVSSTTEFKPAKSHQMSALNCLYVLKLLSRGHRTQETAAACNRRGQRFFYPVLSGDNYLGRRVALARGAGCFMPYIAMYPRIIDVIWRVE